MPSVWGWRQNPLGDIPGLWPLLPGGGVDGSPQTPTSLTVDSARSRGGSLPMHPDHCSFHARSPHQCVPQAHDPTQLHLSRQSLGHVGPGFPQRRYVAEAPRQPEGRRAWSMTLGTPTRSVPVVVDDILYIGGHFTLLALDAHTGQRRWEIRTTGPVHTSPAVAGDKLYLGLQDWRVLALDRGRASPGGSSRCRTRLLVRPLWPRASSLALWTVTCMPGCGYREAHLAVQDPGRPLSPPAFSAGTLFVSSTEGILYALHARTGYTRLRFRTRDRLQEPRLSPTGWSISPLEVRYTRWPPMRVRSPGSINSNWSGHSSGSGNSQCLDRPASPAAGGVFLPGNLRMGFSLPQQWPRRRSMSVIPRATCMPGMP